MKARITALLAVVVVALSLVAAASADTYRPGEIRGWDYYSGAGTVKPWAIKSWDLKAWGSSRSRLRPNPWITGGDVTGW